MSIDRFPIQLVYSMLAVVFVHVTNECYVKIGVDEAQ